jgi:ubiquitin C-terminal hydrolase
VRQHGIVPHGFLNGLRNALGDLINIYEQNDITEFLMLYLDKLNADVSVELLVDNDDFEDIKKRFASIPNQLFRNLAYDMEVAWIKTIKREFSPLCDMFYGQIVSQIVCGNCNHIHHNYEIYCNLSLPLTGHKSTIDNTFKEYFSDEIINKTEKEWKCDACKEYKPSKKSLRLWRNPKILIVSLKRFDSNLVKNQVDVEAPLALHLGPYCISTKREQYKLVAVGNHMGSIGSGHYNCLCRHQNGKWFLIDDTNVQEASKSHVDYVLRKGYMYFYECLPV